MNTIGHQHSGRSELLAKFDSALDQAKDACERLEEKTVAAATSADLTVRRHPYQFAGIALGVGLLLGALAVSCRRD